MIINDSLLFNICSLIKRLSSSIQIKEVTIVKEKNSKVIIITGASSGIGEVTAKLLAKNGASVVLAARREDRLKSIVHAIEQTGGQAVYRKTDVTSPEDMKKLAQVAFERYGRIDVLINNAGLQPLSRLDTLRIQEWDEAIDVNIKGVLHGIAAVLPRMRRQQSGHIINISSLLGQKVIPMTAVYSATKFAVRAITEGLRQEESPTSRIRATSISPGMIDTGVHDNPEWPSISSDRVAAAIAYVIDQPEDTTINDILIRPTLQTI